jgi:hypothetical protein
MSIHAGHIKMAFTAFGDNPEAQNDGGNNL